MGKKAQAKRIRKELELMPAIFTNSFEKQILKGDKLLEQGVTVINDNPVDLEATYVQKVPTQVPVNHARRVKKLVKKYGFGVIDTYKKANSSYYS
jgi:hypothetical protein